MAALDRYQCAMRFNDYRPEEHLPSGEPKGGSFRFASRVRTFLSRTRLSWRPLSFLTSLVVGAISYCGPILRTVRQRTFVCQRLAKVAVLNPRAALLAPIAVVRH